jgi:hypothetical protein
VLWIREAQKHTDPRDPDPDADPEHWHSSKIKSQKEAKKTVEIKAFLTSFA